MTSFRNHTFWKIDLWTLNQETKIKKTKSLNQNQENKIKKKITYFTTASIGTVKAVII